jgi:glycosyltransferase involved in cell wall biosynthesis
MSSDSSPHGELRRIPTPPRGLYSDVGVEGIPDLEIDSVTLNELSDQSVKLTIKSPLLSLDSEIKFDLLDSLAPSRLSTGIDRLERRITPLGLYQKLSGGLNKSQIQTYLPKNSPPEVAVLVRAGSSLGGGTIILYRYANWLVELGCRVTVYSDDQRHPSWANLKAAYRTIIDPQERIDAISEPFVIVYSILDLPRLLQTKEASARKIVHLCQGIEDYHYGNTIPRLLGEKPFFQLLNSLPVERIAVSPAIEKHFAERYRQRCYTIPNGIDTSIFRPHVRPSENRGAFRILTIGRPTHFLKGYATLFTAATKVAKKRSDLPLHLTFIGGSEDDGPLCSDPQYPGLTWQSIRRQTPHQVRDLLYDSDLYINASYYEGFGLPTMEALACGVPVIQADNSGLDGIVRNRESCILVPPANAELLSVAIEEMIDNPSLREKLSRNGAAVAARFSIDRQFESFVEQFQLLFQDRFDAEVVSATRSKLGGIPPDDVTVSEPERFSVILATESLNSSVLRALDSVRAQTYPHWEVLLVGPQGIRKVARDLEQGFTASGRLRILEQKRTGLGAALNFALAASTHPWKMFLTAHDRYEPSKLAVQAEAIKESQNAQFFHTAVSLCSSLPNGRERISPELSNELTSHSLQTLALFRANYIRTSTACIHSSIFEKVGDFDERLQGGSYFNMWLRMSLTTRFHFLPRRTCIVPNDNAAGLMGYDEFELYDAAVSALELLNTRDFENLCPFLNWNSAEEVNLALAHTFKTFFEVRSLMYQGVGYVTPLFDRVLEWWSRGQMLPETKTFLGEYEKVIPSILDMKLPAELKRRFSAIKSVAVSPFLYVPTEPVTALHSHHGNKGSWNEGDLQSRMSRYLDSRRLRSSQRACTAPAAR